MNVVDSSGWLEDVADSPNAVYFALTLRSSLNWLLPQSRSTESKVDDRSGYASHCEPDGARVSSCTEVAKSGAAVDGNEREIKRTPMTRSTISLPQAVHDEPERITETKKVSLSWVMREAAKKYFAKQS